MKPPGSGLAKLIYEISRTNSLDCREFHFFKAPDGLSKNDSLQNRICLDYELARESPTVCEFVTRLSGERRQEMLYTARPLESRFPLVRFSDEAEDEHLPKWHDAPLETAQDAIYPPVACIAASWFLSAWLSASAKERAEVVKSPTEIYDVKPLSAWDFPFRDRQEEKLLITSAAAESNTTLTCSQSIERKRSRP